MIIGVPRETHRHEHRVGLVPLAVARLVQQGHTILIEKDAGLGAHFFDHDFQKAGAQIVHSSEEAYKRPDLVCQIGALTTDELDLLKPGSTICAFHHLAVQRREYVERLPAGEGQVNVTAAGIAEVKVRWADTRDVNNKLELVTRSQL